MDSASPANPIDLQALYRLPWSLSDNAFGWLEVTRACDLDCPYCYQVHDPRSHKTPAQFEAQLDGLLRLRRASPLRLFRRLHAQTLGVMQPQDVLANGEQDVCEGCPNKTFWEGRLVSEGRLEEHLRFGRLLALAPKPSAATAVVAASTGSSPSRGDLASSESTGTRAGSGACLSPRTI